jgi:protein tyrosine/serine phosphatase
MNPSDGAVFVHCAHGADRTGLMIGLWRVQHDGWSYLAAAQEALHYGFFFHRFLGT